MRGQTFLDIVLQDDALEIETDDSGHRIAKVRIDSQMLPITQPDTYQSFNGDSWQDMELEHFGEAFPTGLEWEDYDIEYDWPKILQVLSEAIIEEMPTSNDGILRSVEFLSTYSPREYNFTTDSFDAVWEIDLDALAEWLESRDDVTTVEGTMCELFQSRSGFISHVPGYFHRETEWANVWGAFWLWLQDERDDEMEFLGVAESEHDAYQEGATIHWSASALAKLTGQDAEDIQHSMTQEDIDERVWALISKYHDSTVYGRTA